MLPTTLDAWLSLLEQRHSKSIDLGLERVQSVAQRLLKGFAASVVTVAGTNGKGSVVATIASLAKAFDLKAGVYTSPHLLRFNERVSIDGVDASEQSLLAAFAAVEAARGNVSLTYFEFTTLAALWLFQQQALDLIVLEVGMGGRLDAVNIIEPDVCVITTVDFDHMDYLGHTLEAIAAEKAGICRAEKPVILADAEKLAQLESAALKHTTNIVSVGKSFDFQTNDSEFCYQYLDTQLRCALPQLGPDLVAAGLTAFLTLFRDRQKDSAVLAKAVVSAKLLGRWHVLIDERTSYLDIGHNAQASRRLAQKAMSVHQGAWHIVLGMLKDKDRQAVLAPWLSNTWKGGTIHWYLADLSGPRAGLALELKALLPADAIVSCHRDPVLAWQAAKLEARADEAILVFGSFLTVAQVLEAWQNKALAR